MGWLGISHRCNPCFHALQGDERIRTAVCALGADCVYDLRGEAAA